MPEGEGELLSQQQSMFLVNTSNRQANDNNRKAQIEEEANPTLYRRIPGHKSSHGYLMNPKLMAHDNA